MFLNGIFCFLYKLLLNVNIIKKNYILIIRYKRIYILNNIRKKFIYVVFW